MTPVMWLVIFVILLGIEIATMALTTIWFAAGALVSFVLSFTGIGTEAQLVVFVIVSFVVLILVRPFAKKYVNGTVTKTNAESLVGKQAKVTAAVDNLNATGAAVIDGQEWTARTGKAEVSYEVGKMVRIREIQGVKLIVEELQEEI